MKEKQISGESLGVSETTVESWMERIKNFVKDMTREISRIWMKVIVFSKCCLQKRERKIRVKKS